jgi:peptide deformylase
MVLEITEHDHPALRTKGRAIEKVDAKIRRLAEEMIETMQHADGIGLAAQQVGLPLQMFVLDVPQMKDRPSTMRIGEKPVDVEAHMPMVLLNPKIEPFGYTRTENEGCLSFPGLRGDVPRLISVRVNAQNLDGEEISFEADGLLARAVQHEFDHLQGILFIDRMSDEDRLEDLPEDVRQLARPALVAGR